MIGISPLIACEIARSFEGVTEKDHFGGDAFSANKRMFATVWHEKRSINARFSLEDQRRFLESDDEAFVEIKNAWGLQGWTSIRLDSISRDVLTAALEAAWRASAVKAPKLGAVAARKKLAAAAPVRTRRGAKKLRAKKAAKKPRPKTDLSA